MRIYVKRGDRTRYFVESDGDIAELTEHTRFLQTQRRIVTDSRYRRQLASRMQGCPEVRRDVAHVDLQLRPLIALVARYNRCVTGDDETAFAVEGAPPYTTTFGPVVGISRSTLFADGTLGTISVPNRSYVFDWMTRYVAGIWGTVRQAGRGRHWALHSQLTGSKQIFDGRTGDQSAWQYKEVRIERTSLQLSVLVRYYMTSSNWQPYVEAGPSGDYAVRFDSEQRLFHQIGGGKPLLIFQRVALHEQNIRRLSLGIAAGAGVEARRWTIGLRAEYNDGFSDTAGFSTRALHTYAFVAFHL